MTETKTELHTPEQGSFEQKWDRLKYFLAELETHLAERGKIDESEKSAATRLMQTDSPATDSNSDTVYDMQSEVDSLQQELNDFKKNRDRLEFKLKPRSL